MTKTPLELYQSRVEDKTLSADPAQEQAVQALDALYHSLLAGGRPGRPAERLLSFIKRCTARKPAQNKESRGLYIHGGVGRGKSMIMELFYECLPEGMPSRRVHFHEFMIEAHEYMHARRTAESGCDDVDALPHSLAARIAEQARVLCFDEFHVTDITDAMILGRLFTTLFDLGVVVVATSNWPPDRLYEDGVQRDRFLPFIAFLKTQLHVLHLDSPTDYRMQVMREEGLYFTPLGEMTRKRMDDVFARFTNHAPVYEETLQVKGRNIPVPCVASKAARFSFAQLCEQPHGAEDYLAIAARYHTVFLEGIPKLRYDRRNEAKRLMVLVDALYEAGVRLVVSADAPPEKLYYGHDHGFEFQRTVSRLQEMQSANYLAKS